jgi:hypothetical protein
MLYHPKEIVTEEEKLIVHIPESAFHIERWLGLGEQFSGLSIRWAAGRDANGALVIIGVRHEGRGFDIAFKKEAWSYLEEEPETLLIRHGTTFQDEHKEVAVEIPEGSFGDFIENCEKQAAEDPHKTVIGEIARYFV